MPFTLPQFTKRSDYGKQKYCVRAHFFVPELKDVRDTRIAGERESLIKLHLVKQTSLHSSCQSGRIYVVVNREWYLKELTETNLRHGRPYIIHSTPHPCTQLGFPDALQMAVVSSQQPWGFSLKVKWWQIQEWGDKNVLSELAITVRKSIIEWQVGGVRNFTVSVTWCGSVSVTDTWVLWAI